MARSVLSSVVDPASLDHQQCEALIDELYAVHQLIFRGVTRDAFMRYVVRSSAERTRIEIYRVDGRAVGYAAMHMFAVRVGGRSSVVSRCEVGLLREHRRQTRYGWFLAREGVIQLLRAPMTPIYGLSCATSPATYRVLARIFPELWPHWERNTPPAMAALMDELAERFGLHPVEGAVPGVYDVGWQTQETEQEALAWRRSSHSASRFYLECNPDHARGHGLLVLMPISPKNFLRSLRRLAASQLQRALRRRTASTSSRHGG